MSDVSPEVVDWCARFAAQLGTAPPAPSDIETLLELAGVAAHASQRQSAPIACWLAARAGVSPTDALAVARQM